MNDQTKPFADLMKSWTKLQEDAWRLQSKMFQDAAAGLAGGDEGPATGSSEPGGDPESESPSPFDEVWARSQEAFTKWGEYVAAAMPPEGEGGIGAEMLSHLLDPSAWLNIGINELNQTIEQLSEGAQFADIWQTERRILSATREWMELRQQSLRYRYIIMSAWMRAYDRFYDSHGAEFAESGVPRSGWQGLVRSWLEIANDELLKTQRSEEFLNAQRDLLRASIDFRACQQRFVEEFCDSNGIPSRTEVDDLHRTVTELRREMRALKRELAKTRPPPAPKAAKTRPSRKAGGGTKNRRAKSAPGKTKEPEA